MTASAYTPELAAEIVRRLYAGETLTAICRDEHMPSRQTVNSWRRADPQGFGAECEAAQLDGCYARNDQTLDIADDLAEDPSSRKVRIWARHELNARVRPDLFGSKVQLEHAGRLQVEQVSDEALDARIAELMAKAKPESGQ